MKKWLFVVAVFACIVVAGERLKDNNISHRSLDNELNWQASGVEVKLSSHDINRGKLLLINSEHRLHEEGIMGDLTVQTSEQARGYALSDDTIELSAEVLKELEVMIGAAREKGLNQFILTSGYRSGEEQQEQYDQLGSSLALPPGYSEHQSGLAVDISSQIMKMELAPEGKWLAEHSARFGFILRYPKNKQHITGVDYEPWHYRYVGLPHSVLMQKLDMTLEEYMEYLQEIEQLSIHVENTQYTVSYYSVHDELNVIVPEHEQYWISGNNVDGVVVTSWEEK